MLDLSRPIKETQTPRPKKGYDPIRTPSFFTLSCREVKNGAMDDSGRLDEVSVQKEAGRV